MSDEKIQEFARIFVGVCIGALISWAITYLVMKGV